MERCEVAVVGGGLAGLAAAHAAASAGFLTLHLAPRAPPDRRSSALMGPSVDYLVSAGLIAGPEGLGTPLTAIRLIDATERLLRAPETLFESAEAGLDAFGWNFPNMRLSEAFREAGAKLSSLSARATGVRAARPGPGGVTLELADGGALEAALVVGADGKGSLVRGAGPFNVREHRFAEAALVADLTLSRPLDGTSVEFHYPHGPFTLVPAGGERANLVWIDRREVLEAARAGGRDGLAAALVERSRRLFGPIALDSDAHVFALSTLGVDRAGAGRLVLVGEAAHAFPPIGAQGLNLGLRDVADLAAALAGADRDRPDWPQTVAADYAQRRAHDLSRTGGMVDALFRSLLSEMLPAQALRAGGLWALRASPALRRTAFRLGMGAR
jgi:2-octaprenyl-6-methoxyphenol hydroxylase